MEPEQVQEFLSQYKLKNEIRLHKYLEEVQEKKGLLTDYDFQSLVKTLQDKLELDFEENITAIFESENLDPDLVIDDPSIANFQVSIRDFLTSFTSDIDNEIRTDFESTISKM